ncbi:MAG: hypothetical protein RIC18_05890 [Hoeflea sp.]|uniref:hypothetical protein n=1 Tax=Hoeflea sp. TaxID=1940281 RepID=UPI0032EAE549
MTDPVRTEYVRDDGPPDAGDQNALNEHVRNTENSETRRNRGILTAAGLAVVVALAGFVLWVSQDGDPSDSTGNINIEATVMDNVQEPVPAAPVEQPPVD